MRKRFIVITFVLAFIKIFEYSIVAQTVQIYKYGEHIGRVSQVADGCIEKNTELYRLNSTDFERMMDISK